MDPDSRMVGADAEVTVGAIGRFSIVPARSARLGLCSGANGERLLLADR